jgi:hypothetical protein
VSKRAAGCCTALRRQSHLAFSASEVSPGDVFAYRKLSDETLFVLWFRPEAHGKIRAFLESGKRRSLKTLMFSRVLLLRRQQVLHNLAATVIQAYLGHRSIMSTVRYTAMTPNRFKNFWKD